MSKTTESTPPAPLDPRAWLYHHDQVTDRISFPAGFEDGYRWLKKTLLPFGVDIDTIQTEAELDRVMDLHRDGILDLIQARTLNSSSTSLESRLMKATTRGDYTESRRIRALLHQRQQMGMQVVRG